MSLTRKMLKAMGIEDEKIDQIIDAHTETVDALKTERDSYKEEAGKLPNVQRELDEMKAAKEKDGKDPFKVKYEALKEDFDNFKKGIEQKETTAKKQTAFKTLLKEIGVNEKRLDAVMRVTDLEKVTLAEDGSIKDADSLKSSLKEEWADFIVTPGKSGAKTPNPPADPATDFDTMTDAEYYKATYAKNKEK